MSILVVGDDYPGAILEAILRTGVRRIEVCPLASIATRRWQPPRGMDLVLVFADSVPLDILQLVKRAAHRQRIPCLVSPASWSLLAERFRHFVGRSRHE